VDDGSTDVTGTRKVRLEGVDLLRGLSVLLVVMHHINLRFVLNRYDVQNFLPRPVELVVFWTGYYAVIVFFVISGFLITSLSLKRWGPLGQIHIREFYVMRAARILPCLLLLVAVLSALHLAGFTDYIVNPERSTLGRAVLAALTFHINWLEGHHGYLPGNWDVLWSLSTEEVFYIAFPLVCLILRKEALLVLPLIALIVIGPFNRTALEGQQPWDDYAYLSCMDGIAFGCLAALVTTRFRLPRHVLQFSLVLGIAASLLVLVLRKTTIALGLTTVSLNVTVLELGIALMLIAFGSGLGNEVVSKGTGLIRHIGRRSYEI